MSTSNESKESKAARVAEAIVSRRLSAKQVRERREAAVPRGQTIASNGQIIDRTSARVIKYASAPTTD